ncbi:uncharacterized protein LOC124435143 [Xenia sp. Carnegie-2017]|uniref:uncharacterized protein LOC124435143 n=1 Tax=Xenia sp. Carnegie-2017 TaxID=2897299 RepID=UPI001F04E5CB|nr:uncharacterized protein LOC124435143 [Xenia sp. Carnegie-2017]
MPTVAERKRLLKSACSKRQAGEGLELSWRNNDQGKLSQFEYQQKAKIPRIDVVEFDYDFDDCDWQDDTEFYEEAMKSAYQNKMDVLENKWDDDVEVEDSEDDWIMEYIFLDDKPKRNGRNEHETSISVNNYDLKGKSHFDHARLRSKMQKSNDKNSFKNWPFNSVSLENCTPKTN